MTIRSLAFLLVAACSSPSTVPTPVPPKPTTPACDAFFASPGLMRVLGMADKLATIDGSAWSDYRPEQHALVLLGPDRPAPPTCALVWRGREVARFAIAEPVEMKTGPFRFWTSDPIGPNAVPVMKGLGQLMASAPKDLAADLA